MSARVGIVGYRMGNITSLVNAFRAIGTEVFVAETPEALENATHVVLPGVGAFPKGMTQLESLGFREPLERMARREGRPILGVCLGMQLLAGHGEEHGSTEGLGFIPGRVTRLEAAGLRVPHIGWNDTLVLRPNRMLDTDQADACFYYVHSYRFVPDVAADAALGCAYGEPFVAGVERQNILGVQFHPEKSHAAGLRLLTRFSRIVA